MLGETTGPSAEASADRTTLAHEELARLARGLAHPLRVQILKQVRDAGTCLCGDLVDVLPRAQSTVSQHLKILKESGLIQGEVDGPRVCYCVDERALERLKQLVREL